MFNYADPMITLSELLKVILLGVVFGFSYWKFKSSKKGYLIENVTGLKTR